MRPIYKTHGFADMSSQLLPAFPNVAEFRTSPRLIVIANFLRGSSFAA
jgi:hypothetical protein